ncbi:MAG: LysR family transcriptional regulator [Desulfobacteraceae bacterium]|jgi:molybdate transport system regulatory protein
MKVGYKIWLDNNGKAFGEGPYRLLKLVGKTGSLNKAARGMNMSYRKAWLIIQSVEKKLGFSILERKVGGVSGGGSVITMDGKNLMRDYEKFRKDVDTSLEKLFQKHFG